MYLFKIFALASASLKAPKNINQIFRSYENVKGVQSYRFADANFKKWIASKKELKSYPLY